MDDLSWPRRGLKHCSRCLKRSTSPNLRRRSKQVKHSTKLEGNKALQGTFTDPLLNRITLNPDICHGKPCIRGLRYPLELISELLSSGMSAAEILEGYDDLATDDIQAALFFNARQ